MTKISSADMTELITFVKANYGINLAAKKIFVEMRLQKSMAEHGHTDFQKFFAYICSDLTGALLADFISKLTVNYTLFNRESLHFDFLTSTVLPELYQKEQADKVLRIWSAGCASGEEPYTLAMVLQDYFNVQKPFWDTKILATDISTTALKKAQEAEYPVESIRDLNPGWVKRYFVRDPEHSDVVRITPAIQNEVIFRKLNLVGMTYQFKKKFHFIFCRNVMIYFDEKTKNMLINRLYHMLEDGGYLFIGMSETIDKTASPFLYVQPSVYRKEPATA